MEEVTAVITQECAKISCNFEQVEKALHDRLSEYEGAVFTEDSKTIAKKHVASLRAQKKTFQDNLRDEKKRYMQPWDEFEAQAKRLIAMYDEPINLINGQVQAFEENRIAKKRELISQIYEELVPEDLSEYIPLKRIYNQKWENATTKEKDIRNEISSAAEKVQKDIATISAMESASESNALLIYRTNLDLTEAVSHINAYERQKQEILAREQERIRREAEEAARRAAEEERERKLKEAMALEAAGDKEGAEAAVEEAVVMDEATGYSVPAPVKPKVSGVSTSKDWEITGIDTAKVPVNFNGMELRPVDQAAVMRLIRASKGSIAIPGIAYREVAKMSFRR